MQTCGEWKFSIGKDTELMASFFATKAVERTVGDDSKGEPMILS